MMGLSEGNEIGDELRFWLRALCIEKMVIFIQFIWDGPTDWVDGWVDGRVMERARPEGERDFVFTGFNNTPIDDVVYTKNHCLRVPGLVKMGWDSAEEPMLVPVRSRGTLWVCIGSGIFPTCRQFAHVLVVTVWDVVSGRQI
jgi:hypothetical protein